MSSPPEILTTALHKEWSQAVSWANRYGVTEAFLASIVTCNIWNKPNLFGCLLAEISSPQALELLNRWRETEPAAQLLYDLGLASIRNNLLSVYPKITDTVPAKRHLGNELTQLYVIGMLIERLPIASKQDQEWFALLRLWLLVHVIDRSTWKNFQDSYLHFVVTRVRMASDTSIEWKNFFISLRLPSVSLDFDCLNNSLETKCRRILGSDVASRLLPSQLDLLKNIEHIARHEQKQLPSTEIIPDFLLEKINRNEIRKRGFIEPHVETIGENQDVTYANFKTEDDSEPDEQGAVAIIKTDGNLSYKHQELQAGKIFLATAEELQFLPWSWQKPNPYELKKLEDWIDQNQTSRNESVRLLVTLVWIAMHTANTLGYTLKIRISRKTSFDWSINPDTLALERLPPQRLPGWNPEEIELVWVKPIAEKLAIPIPTPLAKNLKNSISRHKNPEYLGDLWDVDFEDRQEGLFKEIIGQILPRMTPGILGGAFFQRLCLETKDVVFARILSCHRTSALSGSCSYPGWNFSEIQPIMERIYPGFPKQDKSLQLANVIGSRLDPVEPLLNDAIRKATSRVKQMLLNNDPVGFHNYYTSYVATALLAATGARPVTDPFESLHHFDFKQCFVYIDDKSDNFQRGRIVPIPPKLCKLIREEYLSHLKQLGRIVSEANPKLAEEILQMSRGIRHAKLPLFFLLKENAEGWYSVSEKEIDDFELFDWELPLNLFRHRYSRRLRQLGADPEVIDGLMGHAETGTGTYDDFSFRIWADDMECVKPSLEKIFDELPFEYMRGLDSGFPALPKSSHQSHKSINPQTVPFGIEARKEARKKGVASVVRNAVNVVKNFLGTRTLDELSQEEFHRFTLKMLFMDNGLPHPRGLIRYRYLIWKTEKIWKIKRKKCNFKVRVISSQDDPSRFLPAAPGSIDIFQELRQALAGILTSITNSRMSRIFAKDATCVLLVMENRISSMKLLQDILNGRNFRLVTLNDKHYMEYATHLQDIKHDVPVKRYRISPVTAHLLDTILDGKLSTEFKNHVVPDPLQPLVSILVRRGRISDNPNMVSFLQVLSEIADQVNMITSPGIVAGYLGGRVDSYSLMWRDFTRMELGYPVKTPMGNDSDDEDANVKLPTSKSPALGWKTYQDQSAIKQETAELIMGKIQKTIRVHEGKRAVGVIRKTRKELQEEFQSLIANPAHIENLSPTIKLLVLWTCSLLNRKTSQGFMEFSTISRYLTALACPLKDFAFNENILVMDEEDITGLYSNIIESLKVQDTQYVADRLRDFHRWARKMFSIEDPDWNELPQIFSSARVLPGIITEDEYQKALLSLKNRSGDDTWQILAPAFLLFLCYRFGLRKKEALGMQRCDFEQFDDFVVVSIKGNPLRNLKKRSLPRRQVPLLFELSELEISIISDWMLQVSTKSGNNMEAGIFLENSSEWNSGAIIQIAADAIQALKMVTRNPLCTIHHARHSAPNRVALVICASQLENWNSFLGNQFSNQDMASILLGTSRMTRRKLWAVSRYLGHVRRDTTVKNYLHFIGDLANDILKPIDEEIPVRLVHAIDLLGFPRLDDVIPEAPSDSSVSKASTSLLLKFFRLISLGKPTLEAARVLRLNEDIPKICLQIFKRIDQRTELSDLKLSLHKEDKEHPAFLTHIKENGWARLINFAEQIEIKRSDSAIIDKSFELNELADMFSENRQISMWRESHFNMMRAILDKFDIKKEYYSVVFTKDADDQIQSMASKYAFKPIIIKDMKLLDSKFRIDPVTSNDGQFKVQKRCVLCFNKNSTTPVRSRLELMVLMIAFSVYQITAQKNPGFPEPYCRH